MERRPKAETITVVVPTKNRPRDLSVAVRSVLLQTRPPEELVIVDQSVEPESNAAVRNEFEDVSRRGASLPRLQYVHDPAIAGANPARNLGMRMAQGSIVALIEDDIALEPDALERLLVAYAAHPELLGISGIITNYAPPSPFLRLFDRLFTLGPFVDERQPIYWRWREHGDAEVIPVRQMGGLMTWRAEAIAGLGFDETPKTLRVRGEDRDFCFQVSARAGRGRSVFGVAAGARLTHNPSPIGRHQGRFEELRVVSQHWFYSRHLRGSPSNQALYLWWNLGLVLSAFAASIRRLRLQPLRSLARGWRGIREGYVITAPPSARGTRDALA